jgi:hypothetical protein
MHKKPLSLREYRPVFLTPRDDMLSSASGRGLWTEHWQPDNDYCSFTQFALHVDSTAVQVDAALYDHETETRTWTLIDVMPAMEGVEEPLSVGFWNSNALVADGANNFCADAPDFKSHRLPGVRIFHCIREQIRENVPQQALIALDLGWHFGNR